MEYIFQPVTKLQINQCIKNPKITNITLNHQFLSCGDCLKLTEKQINKYLNKSDKISLRINRLFHEDDLDKVKCILNKINYSKIKMIFYSDLGLLPIFKKLNLENKLVYDAYTYTTNFEDVIAYNDFNQYVVVSNQISIKELTNLLEKINQKVIIYGFGKSIIFHSRRPLLTNYFLYRKQKNNPYKKTYYLKEELRDDFYHLYEDKFGSYVYEAKNYYLFNELNKLKNIDYVIIDSSFLNAKKYQIVIDSYLENDLNKLINSKIPLYKGIMENKSVLLKNEVNNCE